MKIRKVFLLIESVFISIYYLMVQFSIIIQPINLILGFLIIFILPGYNLLSILKPDYSIIRKLGYSIILSLAVENIFMILCYIIFYNSPVYPEPGSIWFIFNSTLLITAIIFINLIFIITKVYKQFKSKTRFEGTQVKKSFLNLSKIKEVLNLKVITVFVFFGLSLILLGISTMYSNIPLNNNFQTNNIDYRLDFTFFYRVPLIFYIFLITSIISFIYIIFFFKNPYLILISISMFIYCIWILPYLQIGNYFAHDTNLLVNNYENYIKYGLQPGTEYNFVIYASDSLRYSTALFSTILIMSATNVSLDFALWYLYPMFYIFIPFLFYSLFKIMSDKKKKKNGILIIMVIFASFMPFFIKSGHATGSGVIGVLVYFIIVLEFFNLIQNNKFNVSNSFLIILLYIFLCLTHAEESIYFLILLILFYVYYPFYALKTIRKDNISNNEYQKNALKEESVISEQIVKKENKLTQLKKTHIKLCFLIIIIILVFYFVNELLGTFWFFLLKVIEQISFLEKFYEIYLNSRISIPFFLKGVIDFSILMVIAIILGVFVFSYLIYFIFFKNYNLINRIYNTGINCVKKVYNFISKPISKKWFPTIFFPIIFLLTIYSQTFLIKYGGGEWNLVSIITLILSYLVFILQIFFFLKGILYYELKNNAQNFFLLAIMASASVMVFSLIINNDYWIFLYILQSKFSAFFIFFNLLLIQNTYIKNSKKKNNYLRYLLIIVVLLGVFYSLRKLAYG